MFKNRNLLMTTVNSKVNVPTINEKYKLSFKRLVSMVVIYIITYPKTPITNKFLIGMLSIPLISFCSYFFIFPIVLISSIRNTASQT